MESHLVGTRIGNVRVSSALGLNARLAAEAEWATRDARIQREMDRLLAMEIGGAVNAGAGFGRRILGNGYYELRGTHGARLFIRRTPGVGGIDDIVIVGKATKKGSGNQNEVFRLMIATFPDFPRPFGRYQSRQQ